MRLFEKPHIDPKNFGQDEEVLRRWGGRGGGGGGGGNIRVT